MANIKCYSLNSTSSSKNDLILSWIIASNLQNTRYVSLPEIPKGNQIGISAKIKPGVYFHTNMRRLTQDSNFIMLPKCYKCLIVLHPEVNPRYILVEDKWAYSYFDILPELSKPKEIVDEIPLECYLCVSNALLPHIRQWVEVEYERNIASFRRNLKYKLHNRKRKGSHPRRRKVLNDELAISLGENETW